MKRGVLLSCAMLGACVLASCGLQGRPERPVPLWGNPPNEGPKDPRTLKVEQDRSDAENARKKAAQDAARAKRAAEAATAAATAPASSTATPPPL